MKKILGIVVMGLMIGFLTSCSDNDKAEKPKEKSPAEVRLEKQTKAVKNCVKTRYKNT